MPRILVVTAVAPEAAAVVRGASRAHPDAPVAERTLPGGYRLTEVGPVDVLVGGVGPAAAAAATATALALAPSGAGAPSGLSAVAGPAAPAGPSALAGYYGLVVSSGIAGGFAPTAPIGGAVVAEAIVAADLGAETPDGFADVTELGFGRVRHACAHVDPVAAALRGAGLPPAVGPVLTVSTVTGSVERAAELLGRHPGAVAEAMEGFGVAEAAAGHDLPLLELRTVSNAVGPRDRAAWRIGEALDALAGVYANLPYTTLVG